MQERTYTQVIRAQWEVIALITGLAIVLSLVVSILQPFKYSATSQLLIIQKQTSTLDAYTATKSAEKIGKNLSTIVYTSSFYRDVIDANPEVKAHFSADETDRRKEWAKNVDAFVIPETGILSIVAYDQDKQFASQLARTIAFTIVNKGSEYHGGGAGVEIKIVDDVFVSTYPVRPNIIAHTAAAVFVGFFVGVIYVVMQDARERAEEGRAQERRADVSGRGWELVAHAPEKQDVATAGEEPSFAKATAGEEEIIPLYNSIKTMHDHLAKS